MGLKHWKVSWSLHHWTENMSVKLTFIRVNLPYWGTNSRESWSRKDWLSQAPQDQKEVSDVFLVSCVINDLLQLFPVRWDWRRDNLGTLPACSHWGLYIWVILPFHSYSLNCCCSSCRSWFGRHYSSHGYLALPVGPHQQSSWSQ